MHAWHTVHVAAGAVMGLRDTVTVAEGVPKPHTLALLGPCCSTCNVVCEL